MIEKELNALFQDTILKNYCQGIQWSILKDNKIFKGKIGYLNLETKKEIQEDSIYRIWSMTKPIIAIAAIILVQKKLINFDDPIEKYLPSANKLKVLKNNNINSLEALRRSITIKDLLMHTAGFSYNFLDDPIGKEYENKKLFHSESTSLKDEVETILSTPLLFQPGIGIDLALPTAFESTTAPSLKEVLVNIFPTNPIAAMAEGNMLQIIVFSLLFGIALKSLGSAGDSLKNSFETINNVILSLVKMLIELAPYGIFALLFSLFAVQGFGMIGDLAKYFFLLVFVLIFHAFVTYGSLLSLLARLNPVKFFMKVRSLAVFAFSTSSSSATMPITLDTVKNKLGVKSSIGSFTVPLGATINMDGTAIMQGVATVFISQAYNIDLSMVDYLMVILTATLASIGTAGVPGVGLIMLAMVLEQVGLPVEGIALIIGVDRLLDMTRTAVNVCGDAMVSCVVAISEDEFVAETFQSEN